MKITYKFYFLCYNKILININLSNIILVITKLINTLFYKNIINILFDFFLSTEFL